MERGRPRPQYLLLKMRVDDIHAPFQDPGECVRVPINGKFYRTNRINYPVN